MDGIRSERADPVSAACIFCKNETARHEKASMQAPICAKSANDGKLQEATENYEDMKSETRFRANWRFSLN
jgi:hypothetical protein